MEKNKENYMNFIENFPLKSKGDYLRIRYNDKDMEEPDLMKWKRNFIKIMKRQIIKQTQK
jgi:hypothetical protein